MLSIPFHLLVVHFPIALTIIAVISDAWAYRTNRRELHATGYRLTLWAAAGSLLAIGTGLQLMGGVGFDNARTTAHAGAGIIAGICLIALAIVRYSAHNAGRDSREQYPVMWLMLEVAAGVMVAAAAVSGHRLVLLGGGPGL